jgi:hypothetical protein
MASALDDHKVRGGSALSLALSSSAAAQLGKSSPVDSSSSARSSLGHAGGWLSSSLGSSLASPTPAAESLAQASTHVAAQQQQQDQQQQSPRQQRRSLSFLSCFGAAGERGNPWHLLPQMPGRQPHPIMPG